ncbi:MAG: hypothetical protein ABIO63_02160, partial [Casimicrobiaceae bacterium]
WEGVRLASQWDANKKGEEEMMFIAVKYLYIVLVGMVMSAVSKQPSTPRPSPVAVKGKDKVVLKVGDKVRLKKGVFQLYVARDKEVFGGLEVIEARIEYFFQDVKGLAKLEYMLGGYWSWNVNDLEKV